MPPKKRNGMTDSDVQKKKRRKKKTEEVSDDESFDEDDDVPTEVTNNGTGDNAESHPEVKLEGSTISGEILFCGGTNWDLVGRNALPKGAKNAGGPNLWEPHRLESMKGVKVRSIISGPTACHNVLITTDGKCYTWGRNEKGQLGQGDMQRKDKPTLVESLEGLNIIDAACGKNHTLFLTDTGRVLACGDNKMAQLGLGHQNAEIPSPSRVQHRGPAICKIACGGEFSVVVDVNGGCYTFGCPEYGQLGHNSDGKYFVKSNKMAFKSEMVPRKVQVFIEKARDGRLTPFHDVEVKDVACGTNHVLVLDSQRRIFSWGFGGYGRLGHSEPKDEFVPRLVKFFTGPGRSAASISAGSAYSMAVNEYGALFMWGTNKPTGEAAMYPKLIQDLSGWNVRSLGCGNRSIVIAADESVVAWGLSPTYGELGFGDGKAKSSSSAQIVEPLKEVYVHKIAAGYGHTMMIARTDEAADEAAIDKLPVFDPESSFGKSS